MPPAAFIQEPLLTRQLWLSIRGCWDLLVIPSRLSHAPEQELVGARNRRPHIRPACRGQHDGQQFAVIHGASVDQKGFRDVDFAGIKGIPHVGS